ncbi:hypothetical protein ACFWR6_19550 [Streptomyces griseus]|uniref:hypothetical protein n=1 Tax=Streptomyces griseus TaxID=1911 RepID=UPI00364B174B
MTFEQVAPDTRVTVESRGGIKGTVLSKSRHGFEDGKPVVLIEFEGGATGWNWAGQLSPLDESAPAPKLHPTGARGVSQFWTGGQKYEVSNPADGARGFWRVIRTADAEGQPTSDTVIAGAGTRKAAFEDALAALKGEGKPVSTSSKGGKWTTKELRAILAAGGKVQTTNGHPVTYQPRRTGDRKPWLVEMDTPAGSLTNTDYYRRTAANCEPTPTR